MSLLKVVAVQDTDFIFFGVLLLAAVLVLFILFLFGIWKNTRKDSVCPYTKKPLRPATDLAYMSMERLLRSLYDMHDPENPLIDVTTAAFCRETGRVFPNAIDMFGIIHVNWSFIKKKASGEFVSWGSLTEEQQIAVMDCHNTMEGFQIRHSCPDPDPSNITKEFAYTTPGPLYVDKKNKVLLGWKEVPNTSLEIFVIQKPTRTGRYML